MAKDAKATLAMLLPTKVLYKNLSGFLRYLSSNFADRKLRRCHTSALTLLTEIKAVSVPEKKNESSNDMIIIVKYTISNQSEIL